MSSPDVDDVVQFAAAERREVQRDLRQTLLSGVALTIPFFITLLILGYALNVATDVLRPLVTVLETMGPFDGFSTVLVEATAAALVFGFIFVVGLAAQHGPETHLGRRIDAVMEDIPGLGSIYTSVERMSEVLVEGDAESFQEVKLVEFPTEETFAIAFLTADSPPAIEDATGHDDMVTLFVPMAPNPVMGGHLVSVPTERVYDVDMTVEAGMRAIITTGIAADPSAQEEDV